jgi:phosphoesterase RecJ-like protein
MSVNNVVTAAKLEKIVEVFREYDSFVLTGHMDPDGDCVGSQISLAILLKKWEKTVYIVNPGLPSPDFDFLPHYNWFSETIPPLDIDVAIVMDSGNMERTGPLKDYLLDRKKIINIDHHAHNTVPGDLNYIDTSVSSVGEIIYQIYKYADEPITPEVAVSLYVSIMTDTGCFKHANTTAQTHRVVAGLLENGNFLPSDIYNKIYEQDSLESMHLLGKVLTNLRTKGVLAWSIITRGDFEETNTSQEDLSGAVGYLRQLADCEVAVLFYEKADGRVKSSFRSKNSFDLLPVVNSFGGGGHRGAAGATFGSSLDVVVEKVLSALEAKLNE